MLSLSTLHITAITIRYEQVTNIWAQHRIFTYLFPLVCPFQLYLSVCLCQTDAQDKSSLVTPYLFAYSSRSNADWFVMRSLAHAGCSLAYNCTQYYNEQHGCIIAPCYLLLLISKQNSQVQSVNHWLLSKKPSNTVKDVSESLQQPCGTTFR